MNNKQIIGFIPARYASTRLPGKPLLDIAGLPMIILVLQRAKRAKTLSQVIVLTDDKRIFNVVKSYSGEAMMTPENCRNGTERIAYALEKIKCDIAVNIQGDEPLITGELIDQAVENSINDEKIDIATLACPIKNEAELNDPSSVKVVCDVKGFALYFSRSVIPYSGHSSLVTRHSDMNTALWWKHIGLYAYRSEVVKQVTAMRPTALELTEKLEQLRWLEIGYKIKVIKVIGGLIGVDTKEDLERVRELFKAKGKKLETKGKS